jgi:hypothetical protein
MPRGLSMFSPGLEYLCNVDQLVVHQVVTMSEVFSNYEANNKYLVKDKIGQIIYYAYEDNNCCVTRGSTGRPFVMKLLDRYENEVCTYFSKHIS